MDMENRSLKSQMKRADRLGSKYVLIVGEDELEKGEVILRDMTTKEQVSVPLENMVENVIKKINM
jgi:histidyl-tRNA synthetase